MRLSSPRLIRSFVRREGRLTPGQEKALQTLWPIYGVDYQGNPLVLSELFARQAPLVIDIGFGNGESTLALAQAKPEWNIIGIEVHRPGVGQLLAQLEKHQLNNVRIIADDAVTLLQAALPANCAQRIQVFFPDPWPKKRHHKRRLLQPQFIRQLATTLVAGGELAIATDWQNYADFILATLSNEPLLRNQAGSGHFAIRDALRPLTKFERRGQRLGHSVWDLSFIAVE